MGAAAIPKRRWALRCPLPAGRIKYDNRVLTGDSSRLRRRLAKTIGLSLIGIAGVILVVGAAAFWRLTQGPISLNFIRDRIQTEINASLGGMAVKLGGVVIERDRETGIPHFRLRNVELADQSGEIIARAPRAAVAVDGSALLRGAVVAKQIDLIGPRILVKRNLNGEFELGFGKPLPSAGEPETGGKSDLTQAQAPVAPETRGGKLLDFLSGRLPGEDATSASIASLDAVVVSDAAIQLLDEVNGSVWNIPKASLTFKRMPYGFAFFSEAAIASGERPWHTELSASYRRETGTFSVSARIFDLVISDLADDVFALSQLAQVETAAGRTCRIRDHGKRADPQSLGGIFRSGRPGRFPRLHLGAPHRR